MVNLKQEIISDSNVTKPLAKSSKQLNQYSSGVKTLKEMYYESHPKVKIVKIDFHKMQKNDWMPDSKLD